MSAGPFTCYSAVPGGEGPMPACRLHPRVASPEDSERELEGDPLDWLPPGEVERLSGVASFYDGACVFLTGATGFIGSLVLEKLLRSCHGLSTVYVLVRDKRGVPLRERLRSHLDKEIFRRVREACPDSLSKVVPVAGDCTHPGLGICAADAGELSSKVSVVLHMAATVRFDADLRTAAAINVAATRDLMALARRMPHLKSFVYMSTAYSHMTRSEIDEKYYPPALRAEELLKLTNEMDDEQLSQILPMVLGDWPNTYSFTKAIAEDVVRVHGAGLPVSIIRPSIVTSTAREPVALWPGNLYGITGMHIGCAVGLIHTLQCDDIRTADIVPADLVVNATIACAWDTWCRHSKHSLPEQPSSEPIIYNCVSSPLHPISWKAIREFGRNSMNHPSIRTVWFPCGLMFKQKFMFCIYAVFVHLIPALVGDTFLRLTGKKPILWDAYSRVHEMSQTLVPAVMREWTFKNDNLLSLLSRLQPADHKLFHFDVADIDWEWYLVSYYRGCRVYILNESFDNLEEARRRFRQLKVLHYGLLTLVYMLLVVFLLQKMPIIGIVQHSVWRSDTVLL